jgi:hypothetical protein
MLIESWSPPNWGGPAVRSASGARSCTYANITLFAYVLQVGVGQDLPPVVQASHLRYGRTR